MSCLRRALLASLMAAVGCQGEEADPVSRFAAAYCDTIQPCCAQAGLPTDGRHCRSMVAFASGKGPFSATNADACLAAMRVAAARGDLCGAGFDNESPACEAAFLGSASKKPGEVCQEHGDCAASSEGPVFCVAALVGVVESRRCQVQLRGQVGDAPCLGTRHGAVVQSGGAVTGVAPRGYICDVADDLFCDGGTMECTALTPVGGTCRGGVASRCVLSAQCDTTQGQCVARTGEGGARWSVCAA